MCFSKKMMVRKAKLQKSDSIQFFVNLRDALSAIEALTKKRDEIENPYGNVKVVKVYLHRCTEVLSKMWISKS